MKHILELKPTGLDLSQFESSKQARITVKMTPQLSADLTALDQMLQGVSLLSGLLELLRRVWCGTGGRCVMPGQGAMVKQGELDYIHSQLLCKIHTERTSKFKELSNLALPWVNYQGNKGYTVH